MLSRLSAVNFGVKILGTSERSILMIDEEKLEIDIAEAIGKASASTALILGLMAVLKDKGLITHEDGALITALASAELKAFAGLTPESVEMAESAIRGAARAWTKRLTKQ
jgi:hypothetical protein